MPFKSKAQQRFMFSQHPDIAERWAKETPNMKKLPEKLKGKRKMQGGGIPSQSDFPDYESFMAQQEQWMNSLNPEQLWHNNSDFEEPNYTQNNYVQPQKSSGSPDMAAQKSNTQAFNPYNALRGATSGMSWLSGIAERGRQNQYMQEQYANLAQRNAIPADNFQPNPYNLYAQQGGQIPNARRIRRLGLDNNIVGNYTRYSGTMDENNNPIENPTEYQAMKGIVEYLKHNNSDQSNMPSNVYHPEFMHKAVNEKALLQVPIAKKGGKMFSGNRKMKK